MISLSFSFIYQSIKITQCRMQRPMNKLVKTGPLANVAKVLKNKLEEKVRFFYTWYALRKFQ